MVAWPFGLPRAAWPAGLPRWSMLPAPWVCNESVSHCTATHSDVSSAAKVGSSQGLQGARAGAWASQRFGPENQPLLVCGAKQLGAGSHGAQAAGRNGGAGMKAGCGQSDSKSGHRNARSQHSAYTEIYKAARQEPALHSALAMNTRQSWSCDTKELNAGPHGTQAAGRTGALGRQHVGTSDSRSGHEMHAASRANATPEKGGIGQPVLRPITVRMNWQAGAPALAGSRAAAVATLAAAPALRLSLLLAAGLACGTAPPPRLPSSSYTASWFPAADMQGTRQGGSHQAGVRQARAQALRFLLPTLASRAHPPTICLPLQC